VARQTNRNTAIQSEVETQPFSPVNGARASELVVQQIRKAFFTGMKPGDWLGTEGELAERFGVSRLTMRDAVRTLETYGMVEVKVGAGGGLRIAQVDSKHFAEALAVQMHLLDVPISDLAEVVAMLEPRAARLAAIHRTDAQLHQMQLVLERHTAVYSNPIEFHEAAAEFHNLIAEATGNQPLYVALRAMRVNEEHLLDPAELEKVSESILWFHQELLRAIEYKDAELAERVMDTHSSRMLRRFTKDSNHRTD
jgi:GntR family transcriptional repressor for pyruvate dehydrogenase complex